MELPNSRIKTYSLRLQPIFPLAFIFSLLLSACGGGGGGGGSKSPTYSSSSTSVSSTSSVSSSISSINSSSSSTTSTISNTISEENAGAVVANVQGLQRIVDLARSMTDINLPSGASKAVNPEALAKTQIPCNSGFYSYEQGNNVSEVEFNQCVNTFNGVRSSTNGKYTVVMQGASASYAQNYSLDYDNFLHEQSKDADSMRLLYDGLFEIGATNRNSRISANFYEDYSQTCQGVSEYYKGNVSITLINREDGQDLTIDQNGSFTNVISSQFSGSYTIETLELVRIALNAKYPHAGELLIKASNGISLQVRYVDGGLYINNVYYSWSQFEDQYYLINRVECSFNAWLPTNPGNDNADNSNPNNNNGIGSISATINGTSWSAIAAGTGSLEGTGFFAISGYQSDLAKNEAKSITLSVTGVTQPGTYQLAYTLSNLPSGHATYVEVQGTTSKSWSTSFSGGLLTKEPRLTLTLTTFSAERIAGTFSFEASPTPGMGGSGTVTVTNGEFDVPLTKKN